MTISRRPSGAWGVWVYDPREGRKVYVGQRDKRRGPGGADQLERDAARRIADEIASGAPPASALTCAEYADRWLDVKHGNGTKRPSPTTLRDNRGRIRVFVDAFGDRPLASIERREALDWSGRHPHVARAVAAMFRDAVDDQLLGSNVFANRGQPQGKGRRDITPLREDEVDELAALAVETWGDRYGQVCAAWILFLAWTGCRPTEAFQATWDDVDLERGFFDVRRCKPPYRRETIILPPRAAEAVCSMPEIENRAGDRLLFHTAQGRPFTKSNWHYYWQPVRMAFLGVLARRDPARRDALLTGRDNFDLYELRHFCASWLVENGADEFDGSYQLGNTPEVFRETYLHTYEDEARDRLKATFEQGRKGAVVPLHRTDRSA